MITGADVAAGPLWMEYIAFLKSLPVKDASLLVCLNFSFFLLLPLFSSLTR